MIENNSSPREVVNNCVVLMDNQGVRPVKVGWSMAVHTLHVGILVHAGRIQTSFARLISFLPTLCEKYAFLRNTSPTLQEGQPCRRELKTSDLQPLLGTADISGTNAGEAVTCKIIGIDRGE